MAKRFKPKIGEKVTVVFPYSGMEIPYTVIGYAKNAVLVQECKLIFNGTRYFNTIADDIQPDPWGKVDSLHWAPKRGEWRLSKYSFAVFGVWRHEPNCN